MDWFERIGRKSVKFDNIFCMKIPWLPIDLKMADGIYPSGTFSSPKDEKNLFI